MRKVREFLAQGGVEADSGKLGAELARELGVKNVNRQELHRLLLLSKRPISLDLPVGGPAEANDGGGDLGNFIEDRRVDPPSSGAVLAELRQKIGRALGTLSLREREVLLLRYGLVLEDNSAIAQRTVKPKTLEEVGALFNVTRERIRQIEIRAIRKLQHPSRSRLFGSDFDGIISRGMAQLPDDPE